MNGAQPAMPMYPGRGQHDMQYNSPPHHPPYPQQFPGQHEQHFRQSYYQQPPQQWYYPGMPAMPRPYPHQYQPMMNAPYHMPQPPQPPPPPPSMSARSSQHMSSHSGVLMRPQQAIYSPPPSENSIQPLPLTPSSRPSPPPAPPPPSPPSNRMPFYPPLFWYSVPEETFPKSSRRRRKRKPRPQSPSTPVELPQRTTPKTSELIPERMVDEPQPLPTSTSPNPPVPAASIEAASSATPATSHTPSEADSTQPTTPSSAVNPRPPVPNGSVARTTTKTHPIVPAVPNLPSLARPPKRESVSSKSDTVKPAEVDSSASSAVYAIATATEESGNVEPSEATETPKPSSPQAKPAPKSWADLVRSKIPTPTLNTTANSNIVGAQVSGSHVAKGSSLADVLTKFTVRSNDSDNKIAFIKPRGLVNTGNMCYMNSILQILLFCVPFYDFLDRVSKHATHSFKSETPMVDAMILFIREFSVIDAAASAEQLRLRLKDVELEEYGEAFTPEFVYEVIRRLPRFSSMRRGHQQDAEEFLGFLLEEMHEECVRSMKGLGPPSMDGASPDELSSNSAAAPSEDGGWLEVGPKQRASITRSSGLVTTESPITKIFGGKLRSEFRVPGAKTSVTLEPYQPLQLDIGSPQISNITDALKGLTRSEVLHGEFNSPRGPNVPATKQVFIETLPPVLILHLKRFQYDNAGGTQKIWKKVGYPLDLEIPKEVFPPQKRGGLAAHGHLPKYRLISVVYHHGKSASGGHYTVDIRRQDGREWIRLDDTVLRRVRAEDVAEGGSEEDPKVLAAALEQHKRDQSVSSNIFDQVREEQEEAEEKEKGWSQVNGSSHSGGTTKKWSGVVNGTATPASEEGKRTPVGKYGVKDNKVAYILFYQRVGN